MSMCNEYTCERCGFKTKTKYSLLMHIKRQKPCDTKLSIITREQVLEKLTKKETNNNYTYCTICGKSLHKSGLSRHLKICKRDKHDNTISVAYVEELEKRIQELEKFVKCIPQIVNNTNNTQNIINNHQHINVLVNNFGNEDFSHITSEFLNHCILNPIKGLPSLIEKIHYDQDVPENHNLRFKSWKKNIYEKYIMPNWHECDATNTLDELIKKGYRVLNAYYVQHIMNDPDIQHNEFKSRMYEKFRVLSDKQSTEYNAIKRDLRVLIKDKTAFILASPDTKINTEEIENIQDELEGELDTLSS
jgi:hypothetical protein